VAYLSIKYISLYFTQYDVSVCRSCSRKWWTRKTEYSTEERRMRNVA